MAIGFIGGGNMASALINGLLRSGFPCHHIWATDVNEEKLQQLQHRFNINVTDSYELILQNTQIVILAVKPQSIKEVCSLLASINPKDHPLIISIAAGISLDLVDTWLRKNYPLIRAMPNTPVYIQAGVIGLFAAHNVTLKQKDQILSIFEKLAVTVWLPKEEMLHQITAISGSGPAYFFYVLELIEKQGGLNNRQAYFNTLLTTLLTFDTSFNLANLANEHLCIKVFLASVWALYEASQKIGLSSTLSFQLARETAKGALLLILDKKESLATLRLHVTSKGGTTAAALEILMNNQLKALFADTHFSQEAVNELFYQAVFCAWKRSIALQALHAS